jgi:hypothetical protein
MTVQLVASRVVLGSTELVGWLVGWLVGIKTYWGTEV